MVTAGSERHYDCNTWDEVKEALTTATLFNQQVNIEVLEDIDESFGEWTVEDPNKKWQQGICLQLHGHTVKGNAINVKGSMMTFEIKDDKYKPVTVDAENAYYVKNTNSGLLTIYGAISALDGATVRLLSGCVKGLGKYNGKQYATFRSTSSSEVDIWGGYVTGQEGCVSALKDGAVVKVDYSNATGGVPVLVGLDNAAVAGNGSESDGTTITLGKGIYIGLIQTDGYAACGVYHPQDGTLNIGPDAQIIGYSKTTAAAGVVMRGGKLNMTGGTILADGVASAKGRVGDSRVVVPSSGIVYDDYAKYPAHTSLNISVSGGNVSGNCAALSVLKSEETSVKDKIALTGGTYSSDIAEYIPTGYGSSAESEGKYTVSNEEVAQTIDADGVVKRYSDLKAVLEQYAAGKTVKLMKDVTLTSGDNERYDGIDVAQGNVTFDMNSHTVTGELNSYVIGLVSNTNLTIVDSSTDGSGKIQSNKADCPIFYAVSSDEDEGTAGSLTIKGGTFVSSKALIHRYDDASAKEWTETVNVLNGNYDVPCFNSGVATGLVGNFCGGYYTDAFHANETAIVSRGYSWVENVNETYPWRILSDVYYTTEKDTYYMDRDENNCYVIALNENTDEPLTGFVVGKDVKNVNVTVQKTFDTANEWNAFYAPFDLKVTDKLLEKFEIAKIWDTELKWDGETPQTTIEFIKLKSDAQIPAFTPCLILAKETGTQSITAEDVTLYNTTDAREAIDCSTVEQKFTFTGVLKDANVYNKYVLSEGALVYATDAEATLSPFKFYMTITDRKTNKEVSGPTLVSIRVIGDETNGISEVNDAATRLGNGKVYNLQGVAVGTSLQDLPAGIYVQNGRKYVVK